MHARDLISSQLVKLGVDNSPALMLHASIRKMGPIQGGPGILLDLLVELLPESSVLVMPLGANDEEPFDAKTSATENSRRRENR